MRRWGGTRRGGATALAIAILMLPPPASAAGTEVVKPSALGAWSIINRDHATGIESDEPTSTGTRGEFVDGPSPAPGGRGSFRQVVGNESDSQRVESHLLRGVRLEAITDLSYWTNVRNGGSGVATQIQLMVDRTDDGRFRLGEDDVLTFAPRQQHGGVPGVSVPNQCPGIPGCVAQASWQRWDAAAGGWWSLRAGTYGAPLVTLASYQASWPDAVVAGEVRGLRITAGGDGGAWEGFDGAFDRVRVAGTEYDFEAFFVIADCTQTADDIGEVQRAVDTAPPGYGVRLRGVCDFSAAAPHGGTTTSIAAAAVVLRSAAPAQNLDITSDGAPRSAHIVGSGTQTAFFVPPGAGEVTIRGLAFSSLARPIVVANASDVTIGATGNATPDPQGNSISGGATMNSAVLAVAAGGGGTMTVAYGPGGARTASYSVSAAPRLARLRVAGNRIAYEAAGVPDAARHLVAVDVRQAGAAAAAQDVTIAHNVTWFATNEFRSFDMNAVRIEGASGTPAITDVGVRDNILGRPEDIGEQAPPTSAAGRVGVLIHRAARVSVARNAVRARVSATGVNVPGGGIAMADVTSSTVEDNIISVLAEPGTEAADLGAVGVIDDLDVLFGGAPGAPPSTGVEVRGNTIGQAGAGAQRGIVVAGSSWVDVHHNDIAHAAGAAIDIGALVQGSGAPAAALPRPVTTSVLCDNTLEGVVDDPNQVAVAHTTASNFPGGSLIATNGECLPAGIALVETDGSTRPSEAGATDEYTVALDRRPRATVTVTITEGTQASVAPSTLTFSPADWFSPQPVTVTAVQDTVAEGTHLQAIVHSASSADADYNGLTRTLLALILDDDPGSVIVAESSGSTAVTEGGTTDTYTLVLGSRPSSNVIVSTGQATQVRASPTGVTFTPSNWSIPQVVTVTALDDTIREGTHFGTIAHAVTSDDPNFSGIPVAGIVATVTDNDAPAAPVILVPVTDSTVRSSSLVVTGTGESLATLELTEGGTLLGSTIVPGTRRWSIGPLTFAEGSHTIVATQVDRNGFRSPPTVRTFRIDLTPPVPPVIVAPAQDAVLTVAHVVVRGTAEANAIVVIAEGATTRSTRADGAGNWSITILNAQGEHTIVAYVVDGAGNIGPSSPPRRFFVAADAIPPDPPVILTPAEGAIVPRRVRFTGTTEPNATVQVWEGSIPLGETEANGEGFFDTTIEMTANEPGVSVSRMWTVQARAIDTSSNYGRFGPERNFHVDDTPPTVAIRRGTGVLVGIVLPLEEVTAFGTASDNHGIERIEVQYTDLRGRTITRDATITHRTGNRVQWEDRAVLEPGRYLVGAESYDVAGNKSRRSSSEIIRL